METKKLLLVTLTMFYSCSTFTVDADPGSKRPAEEQAGPAVQEENKVRKVDYQEEFFEACNQGNTETVKTLLQSPELVNINKRKIIGGASITPLGIACHHGHTAVTEQLLLKGTDSTQGVRYTNGLTITPLAITCRLGHTAIAKMLLSKGANRNQGQQYTDGSTITPLSIACQYGQVETAELLLLNGVDRNQGHQNTTGFTITPLGIACHHDRIDIIKFLLKENCSFKRVASDGRNAYQVTQNDEIRELIKQHAIQKQAVSPLSLEPFKKNQTLHFLNCCCSFVEAYEFSEWKYKKLEDNIPLICMACSKANPTTELDTLEYPFEAQAEEENSQAGAAALEVPIHDID